MSLRCPPDELLDRFLAEQLSAAREDELESHVRDCDECRQRLERLTDDTAVTSVLDEPVHPPLPAEFAQRLEDSLRDAAGSRGDAPPVHAEIPGYELLEAIGRGGSSVVYRARDRQLQRTVAIKALRVRAGSVDRERFQREVAALAALHHPNIIRAFGAGEADGLPYLVMEYIAGGTLGSQIAGQPQPPLEAARLVRQLADAIDAAHAAGFVHRDLKPSNVLLDPHFGQAETDGLDRFVPKVTDLGIVKDLSRDDGMTQTRDFLGTPSYMAPEQVQGSSCRVDERTDVYALGAVLYELLTGRPPFRADSPLDTMLLVKNDEPVPPTRFSPKTPRDLETIGLKCLEKDPARRYQSARLLADDLGRLLQGQPILARRTGWAGKLWRWSRRNPGWAASAFFAFSTLLALAIGGPLVAGRERQLRERAFEYEQKAQLERTRARSQFERASKALEGTLDHVLRSARLQDAALDAMRADIVREVVPYYEQFLQDDDADGPGRLHQGHMLLQLASVHTKERHPEQARAAYRRALDLLGAVPDRAAAAGSLATAHMEYGRFLEFADRDGAAAEPHYRRAVELRLELLGRFPADVGVRDNAAIALSLLGSLVQNQPAKAAESLDLQTRACAIRDQLVAEFPTRDDLRHYAALSHLNLGMYHRKYENGEAELRQFQLAWNLERELAQRPNAMQELPYHLTFIRGQLGIALVKCGRDNEALGHLKEAIRVAEALETAYPATATYADLRQKFQEAMAFVEKRKSPPG